MVRVPGTTVLYHTVLVHCVETGKNKPEISVLKVESNQTRTARMEGPVQLVPTLSTQLFALCQEHNEFE